MAKTDGNIDDWIDAETSSGGLAVAGWGLAAVVATVLGFASWQYAPDRPPATETAAIGPLGPDPADVTGSIAAVERGRTVVQAVHGAGSRLAPSPLSTDESVATSRDVDRLRSEIRDLQRRVAQIGLSGDGVGRRLDRIEERMAQGEPAGSVVGLAAGATNAASGRVAEAAAAAGSAPPPLPTPLPKPTAEASLAPPPSAAEAGEPATTGAVPKTAAATDGRTDGPTDPEEAKPKADAAAPGAKAARTSAPRVPGAETVPPVRMVATTVARPAATPGLTDGEPVGIDLGGFRSLATLRRSWTDMGQRHGDLSKGLEPRARLRETDTGIEARLLAGPFPDATEAARVCLKLKAAGAPCTVTGWGGQPVSGLH